MILGTVTFEETGDRRTVTRFCDQCRRRGARFDYPNVVGIEDVMLVGPDGVAHHQDEFHQERTLCGRDATKVDWWWRL